MQVTIDPVPKPTMTQEEWRQFVLSTAGGITDATFARHGQGEYERREELACEYCQMPQEFSDASHELDHVIAEKHRGSTTLENLALACFECNNHKGPNISGMDPASGEMTRLFHPRQDLWSNPFVWQGPLLAGITAVGRTTVEVLAMNLVRRLIHRQALIEEGSFPPPDTAE